MEDTIRTKGAKKVPNTDKNIMPTSTTQNSPNGMRNALLLLCFTILLRELIYEYKMLNILNVYKLVHVQNIPMVCLLIILLVIRALLVYFSRNNFILYISEITFYIFIDFQFKGVLALNLALLTVVTFMKLHSFLQEISKIEETTEKYDRKNDLSSNESNSLSNPTMAEEKIVPEYPHDSKKDDCEEFSISVWFFVRYMISPSFIFSNKYPRKGRSYLRLIFSLICLIISLAIFNLFSGMYFFPSVFYFQLEFTLFGLVQYLKLVYSSFIFWILFFFLFFKYFLNFLSELTDIAVPTYKSWWNCNKFEEFWRDWNVQAHSWLKKYVFGYLLKRTSPMIASFSTFFFSAIVHELLIFFMIRKIKGVAFLTILLQYLFISAENTVPFMNNMNFWILFCFIGQPCALIAMGPDLWRCLS